jgi:hypothetical protein
MGTCSCVMSERLNSVVRQYLIEHGDPGLRTLAKKTKKSLWTMKKWVRGDRAPAKAHDVYMLVLACDRPKDEAMAIAQEMFPANSGKASA